MNKAIPPSSPSGTSWQFVTISNGELRTKDRDKNVTLHPVIEGTFRRVGVHKTEWNGQQIESLEAEIEGHNGTYLVQTALKSSVATGMFGSALVGLEVGDFIAIRAQKSKEPNTFGAYMTFVEIQKFDPGAVTWRVVKGDKDEYPGNNWADKQDALLDALSKHPAYAEREARVSDREASEYDLADAQLRGQGWPSLTAPGAPEVYLGLFNKALKTSYKDYAGIGDNEWNELRRAMAGKPCPKSLEKFLAPAAAAIEPEYDPFADE